MSRSFINFSHRVDLYQKGYTVNDTGQRKPSWTLIGSQIKCFFTPSGANTRIRLNPTMEESDTYTMFFPHDIELTYGSRLENIKTWDGELIYSGPLQIDQIDKQVSQLSGKIQYLQVKVKTVIE